MIYLKFDGSGVVCVVCESTLQTNLTRRCRPFPLIVSFVCCGAKAVEFVMNRFDEMKPNVKAGLIVKKEINQTQIKWRKRNNTEKSESQFPFLPISISISLERQLVEAFINISKTKDRCEKKKQKQKPTS